MAPITVSTMKSRVAKAPSRSALVPAMTPTVSDLGLDLSGHFLCDQRIAQPQSQLIDNSVLPHERLGQIHQRIDLPFVDTLIPDRKIPTTVAEIWSLTASEQNVLPFSRRVSVPAPRR